MARTRQIEFAIYNSTYINDGKRNVKPFKGAKSPKDLYYLPIDEINKKVTKVDEEQRDVAVNRMKEWLQPTKD